MASGMASAFTSVFRSNFVGTVKSDSEEVRIPHFSDFVLRICVRVIDRYKRGPSKLKNFNEWLGFVSTYITEPSEQHQKNPRHHGSMVCSTSRLATALAIADDELESWFSEGIRALEITAIVYAGNSRRHHALGPSTYFRAMSF